MKARDAVRLSVMRGILTAFTNELVSLKRMPQDTLTDEEALTVIRRLGKQRKDSIEQFQKGNRPDLAQKEEAELAILDEFLPAQMQHDELEQLVRDKKNALGITDAAQIGKLIGAVMQEADGRTDGNTVREVIQKILSE